MLSTPFPQPPAKKIDAEILISDFEQFCEFFCLVN